MAIDFHHHLVDSNFHNKHFRDMLIQTNIFYSLPEIPVHARKEWAAEIVSKMFDRLGIKIVEDMNAWGIDQAILLATDYGLLHGEVVGYSVLEHNYKVIQVCRDFPDRLIPFLSVDPRRPNAIEIIDHLVQEGGMRGVKCHPDAGWFPDDPEINEYWEKISTLGLPVVTHVGPVDPPSISDCAHPCRFEKVLSNFPDLILIAAHMGSSWRKELMGIAKKYANLYCDISGWQPVGRDNWDKFVYIFRKVLDAFGYERVLFGTDEPVFRFTCDEGWWIKKLQSLSYEAPSGYHFSEFEIQSVLSRNAIRILRGKT